MNKFRKLAVALLVTTVFLVAIAFSNSDVPQSDSKNNLTVVETKIIEEKRKSRNTKSLIHSTVQFGKLEKALSAAERFNSDIDYFNLALELLNAAQRGDDEAQYYLAKVLVVCEDSWVLARTYKEYSSHETRLQQKLIEATLMKCNQFDENNFDSFDDFQNWLKLSANTGYSPALIANLQLLDKPPKHEEFVAGVKAALTSRNPDAIFGVGYLTGVNEEDRAAWQILSCDFGYDCSKSSSEDWIYAMAAGCALASYNIESKWTERCQTGLSLDESIELKLGLDGYSSTLQRAIELKRLIESELLDDTAVIELFAVTD